MYHYLFKNENLKSRRVAQGLTQDALAKLAAVDPGSVSKIESGSRLHPRADIIGRLAGALKVTPNYFYEKQELPDHSPVDREENQG